MPFAGSTFTKLFNWAQDAIRQPKIQDARIDAELADIAAGLSSLGSAGALDTDLTALANNSTNGIWARTGSGTGSARTLTGTANEITATNGDGVSGNPTLSLPSALTFTSKTVTGGTYVGTALTGSGADPSTTIDNTTTNNTLINFKYGAALKYQFGIQSAGAQFNLFDSTLARYPLRYGLTSGDLTLQPTAGVTYVARTTTPAQPIGKMVVGDGVPIGTNGASGSDMMTVMSGSNASPITTNTASLMVNRTELLASGGATNGYSAAIVGEVVGLVGDMSQTTGIIGYATQYGSFDTCGILGVGVQNGTGGCFGGYFNANAAVSTADGQAIACTLSNNTGSNFTFSGAYPPTNRLVGVDIEGGNASGTAKRSNAGIGIRASAGVEFDVGIGLQRYASYKADIQSDTNATTILLANSGTHTNAIDLRGATISTNHLITNNIAITTAGAITGSTFSTGTNTFQINGSQATTGPDFSATLRVGVLVFKLASANMNSTADQAISIVLPTGFTAYRIQTVMFSKPSISLTTAVGGIYTAASKGGTAVVAASQVYSSLTTNTAEASGSMLTPVVTNVNTAFYNAATLYLSLTTPQGAAATVDVQIIINPLL